MRTVFKWLTRIFGVILIAAIAIGFWKREEIKRLLAVNSMFETEKIVQNFSRMNTAFINVPVSRGNGPVSELSTGEAIELPDAVNSWVKDRNVTAVVVVKDGQVRFEEYFLATGKDDKRIGWSVSKSFLSALVGVLLDEGAIESLDVPVVKYAPELKGSAYDGATLLNVLQMSSGVTFDEDYLDYDSDINQMARTVALGGALDDFTAALKERFAEPGSKMKYVSIDTHVVGMVLRGATDRSVPELMSEKIIQPLGLEGEPYYVTDGEKVAFVLGGLNMSTRDYARFGIMVAQDGKYSGKQVVPAKWLRESTAESAKTEKGKRRYGYQWWIPAHDPKVGEFYGHGIYGQYLYVDRERGVVIVVNSADKGFKNEGVSDQNIEMLRLIADEAAGG